MRPASTTLARVLLAALGSWAAAGEGSIRPPALAGAWYPDEAVALATAAHEHLRAARAAPRLTGKPTVLLVPHAGWAYSAHAAAAAFRALEPGDATRVVLVAPSHRAAFEGFSIDGSSAYRTPLGEVPVCDSAARLRDGRLVGEVPGAADQEHAIEIELPFLQEALREFCLVPVLAGRTTPEQERALAAKLAALHDGKTLFVFSSDFIHYGPRFGYAPFGPTAAARGKIRALDERAAALLGAADVEGFRALVGETGATICGHSGLGVMAELLPHVLPRRNGLVLAHYSSLDLPGAGRTGAERSDAENLVDYVAMAFGEGKPAGRQSALSAPSPHPAVSVDAPPVSAADGARLVRLARAALATQIAGRDDVRRDDVRRDDVRRNDVRRDDVRRELAALPDSAAFDRLQGVFVTLKKNGDLRGCIGQILPAYPLFAAVTRAAVDAALHDPRFAPVTLPELAEITVEITLLSAPHRVASARDIVLGTHGIILEKQGRRAVFLPQVPGEQGWSLDETLTALARKAGLPADGWREGANFDVFTGQVFHETQEKTEKPR